MSSHLETVFPDTGKKGNSGEVLIFDLLKRTYDEVLDWRLEHNFQSVGVDFAIKQKNWKRFYTLDVKSNLYLKEKFYGIKIELIKKSKPGWLYTSKADEIYHCCTYNKKYIKYNLSLMRYFIFINKEKLEIIKYNNDVLIQLYYHFNQETDLYFLSPLKNI